MSKLLLILSLSLMAILTASTFSYSAVYTITQLTETSYSNYSPPQINDNGHVVWCGHDGNDYEIFLARPNESIQDAVDSSSSGDTIYIPGGTYEGDLLVEDKDIVITGGDDSSTLVKGKLVFKNSNSLVEGLTILYNKGEKVTYSDEHYTDFEMPNDSSITAINSEITVQNSIIMPDPVTFGENKYGKGIQIWSLYGDPDIEPLIENNLILNCEAGVYLYSQASGGAISGSIKNNTFDLNDYGIVLRMHKESPLIQNNIMTRSLNAIHFTYDTLLSTRWDNIKGNFFGSEAFDNTNDLWMEQRKQSYNYTLFCPPPGPRRVDIGCFYCNGNMDGDPEFMQPYEYPSYIFPLDLDYTPQNPDCIGFGVTQQ